MRARTVAIPLVLLQLLAGAYACGGKVAFDASSAASSSSAGSSSAGSTSVTSSSVASSSVGSSSVGSSSIASSSSGDLPDASTDPCTSTSVCSRVQTHAGCAGETKPGVFCDFLGTPCEVTPPSCAAIEAIVGFPTSLASCGNGTSFCNVLFAGTLDDATFAKVCEVRAKLGEPLDCFMD